MGLLKDIILETIRKTHPDAHWVENEKPRMIKSVAQSKYDNLRKVESNYARGVSKARKDSNK